MAEDKQTSIILHRRVYGLTRAVLEMVKYLQYSKLYFQWKLWYRKSRSEQCVKVSQLVLRHALIDRGGSVTRVFKIKMFLMFTGNPLWS